MRKIAKPSKIKANESGHYNIIYRCIGAYLVL